jgi:hypothetical protein
MASIAFSCFVDENPVLKAQAFIWVNCLKRLQNIEPESIFVHTTAARSQFRDWLSCEKVNIVEVEHFDKRNVYCNKIQQLASFRQTTYDQILFMDCDTAWIGKEKLPLGQPLSARIVDLANPPESVLKTTFSASGLGPPDWWPVAFPQGPDRALTDVNNCNGGLYICAGEFVKELAPRWRYWALWCLDNSHLFESFSPHADQVSFALAMRELNAKVSHLPLAWNYPTHLRVADLPDVSPQILHYHGEMTGHLKVKSIGISRVDYAIDELNKSIAGFIRENLLNAVFWDLRYHIDPELGSGIGSRGASLDSKRRVIADALASFVNGRIVDVGCGDLEVTRNLGIKDYLGLDVAEEAVGLARGKRPDWTFQVMQAEDRIPEGDVVLCIDVLIHQPDERQFFDLIGRLAQAARSRLIVTGYDGPPTFISEITRYYLPITEALRRTGAFKSIEILGRYRDVVVVAADKGDPATVVREVKAVGASTRAAKVIVGSGWWCDNSPHDWALGSPATRSAAFFDLWYQQVLRCLRPDRIVVTDSASPIKPDLGPYDRVQWIELDRNYGHVNDIRTGRINTKYSGSTRSVINGAMYALCCDADFYVYVEQDCLLYGKDFLTEAVGDSTDDILLGSPPQNGKGLNGSVAAPMLQQSLIIVRRPGLERFLIGLLGATASDGEVSPEETMRIQLAPFDFLRVPYGRSRPIDFDRSHFYVQHLDDNELSRFLNKLGPAGSAGTKIPSLQISNPVKPPDGSSSSNLNASATYKPDQRGR